MKRIILVLALVLALSISAFADPALDAAVESGSVALVETETAGFDLAACSVVVPDAYWSYMEMEKPSDDEIARLAETIAEKSPQVFSVSPTGQSALLSVGQDACALYDGVITVLCPNEERGVADEFGNMKKTLYPRGLQAAVGAEGMVWSPDGRYAALVNYIQVLASMKLNYDPMLIDAETGDVFLVATSESKPRPGSGASAVTVACFSADSRYFYYGLYSYGGEYSTALYRYDLESGESEMIYGGDLNIYYPRLAELNDGSLLALNDARTSKEMQSVVAVSADGQTETHAFSVPAFYWYSTDMACSAASGYAVVRGSINRRDGCGLQVFRPGDDFAGLDQFWLLRSDAAEFEAFAGKDMVETALEDGASGVQLKDEYRYIHTMNLSPDGAYALVTAGREGQFELVLVRLEDMKAARVTCGAALGEQTAVEWNSGELVISSGREARTYRFDAEG